MEEYKSYRKWIVLIIVGFFVALMIPIISFLGFSVATFNKVEHVYIDKNHLGINQTLPEQTVEKMATYTNIAIFGLDNRSRKTLNWGNSDVIMIASINDETKEVKLVSVYRDTFLNIGDEYGGMTKCNAAYARGGAQAALAMLNSNLDLNLTNFVAVDWNAVTEVVDELGGVDIDITNAEVKDINNWIEEINRCLHRNSSYITTSGTHHLDGVQATAYCRIRHTIGHDFERASRQRIMIEALLKKAKEQDVITLANIINKVADDVAMSLELSEVLELAKDVNAYSIKETTGFPFHLSTKMMYCGSTVIPLGFKQNVVRLHEFLFEEEEYVPSEVVEELHKVIIDKSGLDENSSSDYDMDKYNDTTGLTGIKN